MQEYIYIIVAQTGTNVAKAIKMFTKKPYNHVSLAGDSLLTEMYSFCRTYPRVPLPATFNREIVGQGTLGLYDNIPCEIYEVPVTHDQKIRFETLMRHFSLFRNFYSYNVLGLLAMTLRIKWSRKTRFLCSQFVAYTFVKLGLKLEKPPCMYTPDDFRYFPGAQLIYRGELNYWHSIESSRYLSREPEIQNRLSG